MYTYMYVVCMWYTYSVYDIGLDRVIYDIGQSSSSQIGIELSIRKYFFQKQTVTVHDFALVLGPGSLPSFHQEKS